MNNEAENKNTNPNANAGAEAPKDAPKAAPQEENKPFYKKGWFWATVGGVAVLAGGAVGYFFMKKGDDAPAIDAGAAAAA